MAIYPRRNRPEDSINVPTTLVIDLHPHRWLILEATGPAVHVDGSPAEVGRWIIDYVDRTISEPWEASFDDPDELVRWLLDHQVDEKIVDAVAARTGATPIDVPAAETDVQLTDGTTVRVRHRGGAPRAVETPATPTTGRIGDIVRLWDGDPFVVHDIEPTPGGYPTLVDGHGRHHSAPDLMFTQIGRIEGTRVIVPSDGWLPDDLRLTVQVRDELERALVLPVEALLGHDLADMLRRRTRERAPSIAAMLHGDADDDEKAEVVIDLMNLLWPVAPEHAGRADWWRTPLGRACAASLGRDDAESVSHSVAAAMLGVTRGTVAQLVSRGTLDRHPDGGVLRASVLQRIQERG